MPFYSDVCVCGRNAVILRYLRYLGDLGYLGYERFVLKLLQK